MRAPWKRLFGKKKDPGAVPAAPGVRCTHCRLVVEEPDSLFCPRCYRPLVDPGCCGRCRGCGGCARDEQ